MKACITIILMLISHMVVAQTTDVSIGVAKALATAFPIFEKSIEKPLNFYAVSVKQTVDGYECFFFLGPIDGKSIRGGDVTVIVSPDYKIKSTTLGR